MVKAINIQVINLLLTYRFNFNDFLISIGGKNLVALFQIFGKRPFVIHKKSMVFGNGDTMFLGGNEKTTSIAPVIKLIDLYPTIRCKNLVSTTIFKHLMKFCNSNFLFFHKSITPQVVIGL